MPSWAIVRRRRARVLDEASHFVSESWGPRTLERIWQAARPLLTIYGEDGRTFGISTPADGDDFYGRLFVQANAGGIAGGGRLPRDDAGTEPGGLRRVLGTGKTATRRKRLQARVHGRVHAGRRWGLPRGGCRRGRGRSLSRAR